MLAPLEIIDVTNAAPGLVVNSDTNTGFFRPCNQTFAMSVSGTERGRFVNGSLLQGQTSSTAERLQVTGPPSTNDRDQPTAVDRPSNVGSRLISIVRRSGFQ